MMTFAALFASCAGVLFLLWLAERQEVRFWREQTEHWKRMHKTAAEGWGNSHALARFWMDEAMRGPFRGKPKEVPRA